MTRKSIFLLQFSSKLGGLSRAAEQERKKKVHYLQRQKESRRWKDPRVIPGSVRQEKKYLELSLGYRAKPYHKKIKTGRLGRQLSISHAEWKDLSSNSQDPCVKEARCRAPVRGWGENRSMGQAVWHSQQTNESSQAGAMSSDLLTSTSMLWHSCPCIHAHPKACAHADKHMYIHINKIFKNLKQEKGRSKASTNFYKLLELTNNFSKKHD